MKTTFYTLFALAILSTISCKDTAIHSPLVGRWRVVGYYLSSGGPQYYVPASNQEIQYIQFKDNGLFSGNAYKNYASYSIKDNRTVVINYENTAPDYASQPYKSISLYFSFRNDTLSMSPAGPVVCIEGCSTRFVRY